MSAGIVELPRMLYCPSYKRYESGERSLERSGRRASTSQSFASHHHPCTALHTTFRCADSLLCMRNLRDSVCSRHFFRSPHVASVQALQFGFMLARTPCTCTMALLFLTAVRWRPMGKSGANGLSVLRARHASGNTHGMCVGGHLDHSRVAQKATLV